MKRGEAGDCEEKPREGVGLTERKTNIIKGSKAVKMRIENRVNTWLHVK